MDILPVHFLKLGGSLITDKHQPGQARYNTIRKIAAEIAVSRKEDPEKPWIIGHGSGSFGHVPAKKFGTRSGVRTPEQWLGFAEVWHQATTLTRIVVQAFATAGLAPIGFSPSAAATTVQGLIQHWDIAPLKMALENGLMPIVHGDVTFDPVLGGTVVSTEEVFAFLAQFFLPQTILIAGIEPGVWADYPACSQVLTRISPANIASIRPALTASAATDVTGGMAGKVEEMLALAAGVPGLKIRIFDGRQPENITKAMAGEPLGTLIEMDD